MKLRAGHLSPSVRGYRCSYYSEVWRSEVERYPKLRTYRLFKTSFKCEHYLLLNLQRNQRSVLAQFRLGILPLRIETGRYIGEAIGQRQCNLCGSGHIESELHFLLECSTYTDYRQLLLSEQVLDISTLTQSEQFVLIVNSFHRRLSNYLERAYMRRRSILYN